MHDVQSIFLVYKIILFSDNPRGMKITEDLSVATILTLHITTLQVIRKLLCTHIRL